MKASMTLKPLVFAIAAVMAVAAQASNNHDREDRHHHKPPVAGTKLDPKAGDATAYAGRDQYIGEASSTNVGTENRVKVENSLESSGNIGANVAAGDMNQQANNVAIATSDESFVFGVPRAESTIAQEGDSWTHNIGGRNEARIENSGNGASGNIGVNAASGNFNQQQNALAIATANGYKAVATATGSQSLTGGVDNDPGSATYTESLKTTSDSSSRHSGSSSESSSESSRNSYTEKSSSYKNAQASLDGQHSSSQTSQNQSSSSTDWKAHLGLDAKASASASIERTGHDHDHDRNRDDSRGFDAKAALNVKVDADASASLNHKDQSSSKETSDWSKSFEGKYKASEGSDYAYDSHASSSSKSKHRFEEVASDSLATTSTYTRGYTFVDPVKNVATLSGSLNGASGNIGVNVASGSGNQQLNTLAVAVGCNACSN